VILQKLQNKKLIHPPEFLLTNTAYLTIMGSQAYGVAKESSDTDIYGFCIPKKEDVFPHLRGEILDFGTQKQRFFCWQEHHIKDTDSEKEYDFQIYSIIRYFHLLMENNPNIIDSIFTPINCVIHSTQIGNLVRDNRKSFIHKGLFHKFRGYSLSQIHKMKTKDPIGKRKEIRDQYGYDLKFATHVIRLLLECEQLLETGDLDLQKGNEVLKSIRRGEWTEESVKTWFEKKDKSLEELYSKSALPYGPNEEKIKKLLLQCLEIHYGSLSRAEIVIPNAERKALEEIKDICNKLGV